jgi:hypothetical protein
MTLAKHYSRKRVIEAAKAAGIRPSSLSYAELNRQAIAHCEAHREEMIAKAIETIARSPKLQQLCEQRPAHRIRRDLRLCELPCRKIIPV